MGSTGGISPTQAGAVGVAKGVEVAAGEGYMERCLLRHMLVKCGHKEVLENEVAQLKLTLMRVGANNMRCAVFGRVCGLFSRMPHGMTELLVALKAHSWHAVYPTLDWYRAVA